LGSRRLLEHRTGSGAGAAHRHEEMAQRARAVSVLIAVSGLVTLRLSHTDLGPISVQFVRHHHCN
jgi:hypothetical protein